MNSDSAAIAELVREARTDVSCRQLSRPSAVPAVEVNKRFLESTIRTVEDHNRREEVDTCWRIKKLENELDRKEEPSRTTEQEQMASRQMWADKKLKRLAEIDTANTASDSAEQHSNKKQKKESKKEKKKEKRAKKEKKAKKDKKKKRDI